MKAIVGLIAVVLLLGTISPVFATQPQINILGINPLGGSLLGIDLELAADIDLNILGLLAIDVNVVLVTDDGRTFVGCTMVPFQGIAGEVATAIIDVGDEDFLTAHVVVSLGNLHLDLDLDLDLDILLGDDLVGNLVDGVLDLVQQVNTVVDLLNGLLGSGYRTAQVAVVGVQTLQNNQALVSLQLQDSVPGGLTLDLNVDILDVLGIVAHIDTRTVVFSGIRGQIVNVVVDLSAANSIIDANVSLQLSIANIHLNLNLNIQVLLDLHGLNNLLDNLLHILNLDSLTQNLLGSLPVGNLPVVGPLLGGSNNNAGSVNVDKPIYNPYENTLTVPVVLLVDSDLPCGLGLNLNVMLFSNTNVLLNQVLPVHLSGVVGDVANVVVDLNGLDLDADLFVSLNLLGLQLDLDLDLQLDLCDIQLFNFVDGLLTQIVNLVDQLLGGLL